MCSAPEGLTLEPLHRHPDLLDACVDLINEEWPRSRASRQHTLRQSSDTFPLSLGLLQAPSTPGAPVRLLGHARLSRVMGQPHSLFLETVVVSRAWRGQGYGRRLLEATEGYARDRGFRQLHLTTRNKQHFYAHLGYVLSTPVQSVAFCSTALPAAFLQATSCPASFPRDPPRGPDGFRPGPPSLPSAKEGLGLTPTSLAAAPPPPPPLPPSSSSSYAIHVPPIPPPLPPDLPISYFQPPLLSHPELVSCLGETLWKTQYQDLRGRPIFWMKKDI
ncbi:N-alpha-acetyltransferase 80 [Ornithorhynchus anatinus]|uniref:N-alpha-acetyltransferase 80 n=1 Tax=Ornithorhynchus anatinus TaxID=9258 RepID=UPI0010A91826|nr:N-alpha-acetyltransferase 80 [Ornithorhynchus anatinus]XP_028908123.1 N-alpha-acetyltransferase 80 [Ornithorhynchus anatinus]XP_028908125.1 N-alpha-acetyltransferase 80 [Ornithorhynchus anatinus]XP_028908126.1 N-alpha-acetyltransferase 80 [Ornithorhynchus anatinus]